jgi:hypothetical protein
MLIILKLSESKTIKKLSMCYNRKIIGISFIVDVTTSLAKWVEYNKVVSFFEFNGWYP